jgi:hypothetical protein
MYRLGTKKNSHFGFEGIDVGVGLLLVSDDRRCHSVGLDLWMDLNLRLPQEGRHFLCLCFRRLSAWPVIFPSH